MANKNSEPSELATISECKPPNNNEHRAMALQLFSSGHYTLQQAARFSNMPLESFISLLGEHGVDAVDYPTDELDTDLKNALVAAGKK